MKRAAVSHSLIRQDVVQERLDMEDDCEEACIDVPYGETRLTCRYKVAMTWIRPSPGTNKTHETVFYLVANVDEMDVDILLGTADSGEGLFLSMFLPGAL